jgi:hypothetical protein
MEFGQDLGKGAHILLSAYGRRHVRKDRCPKAGNLLAAAKTASHGKDPTYKR